MNISLRIWTGRSSEIRILQSQPACYAIIMIMMTSLNVTGEFPPQRPVTRSVDVFFLNLRPNKRLGKQSRPSDLRRHRAHYDFTIIQNGKMAQRFMGNRTPWYTTGALFDPYIVRNTIHKPPYPGEAVLFDAVRQNSWQLSMFTSV